MSKYPEIITGHRFGRLRVLCSAGLNAQGRRMWLCRCDCGNEIKLPHVNLVHGKVQHCGCPDVSVVNKAAELPRSVALDCLVHATAATTAEPVDRKPVALAVSKKDQRRKYMRERMRKQRAAEKAALPPVPPPVIKRPNGGPLDRFLYAHPAPQNIVFLSGDAQPLMLEQDDRRYMVSDEVVTLQELHHVKNKLKGMIPNQRIRINSINSKMVKP
jgi:hypothetical protein